MQCLVANVPQQIMMTWPAHYGSNLWEKDRLGEERGKEAGLLQAKHDTHVAKEHSFPKIAYPKFPNLHCPLYLDFRIKFAPVQFQDEDFPT